METNASSQKAVKPNNKRPKIPFTTEEDQIICNFVQIIGTKKWPLIAKFVPDRTAKQCRDRYMNYLKPGLSNIQWTKSEDDLLIQLHLKFGSKWSTINKYFPNRNQISLKNRIQFLQKYMPFDEHNFSQKANDKMSSNQPLFEKNDRNFNLPSRSPKIISSSKKNVESIKKSTNENNVRTQKDGAGNKPVLDYENIFDTTFSSFSLFDLENEEYFSI